MQHRSHQDSATHATRAARTRQALLTAVGVTVLSLVAVNVQAEEAAPQRIVSLAGLDLSRDADAKTAYSRLRSASKAVCKELDQKDWRAMRKRQQCYETALANAVADVDNGKLTRLHSADRTVRIAQRATEASSGG